jgi:hypothetical protein
MIIMNLLFILDLEIIFGNIIIPQKMKLSLKHIQKMENLLMKIIVKIKFFTFNNNRNSGG